MYKGLKVALVIPAYNEERLIVPTLKNVPKTIDKVYVVDDASTDNTPEVVRKFRDKRIELLRLRRNLGPGYAIIIGYNKSAKEGYDVTVVIGGDNQMDLKDLPNFLEPFIKDEADYVKGNRFMMVGSKSGSAFEHMPRKRFFGNSALSFLTKLASGYWSIFDTQDGYTAISKKAIETVDWHKVWGGYGYPSDFLVVFNIYNLRVKDVPRRAIYLPGERQSQIKVSKYILKMSPLLIKRFFWRLKEKYIYQEFHPLIFFYFFGIVFIPLGFLLGIRAVYYAIKSTAPTNETILTALFIITGLQFLFFAISFDMQVNAKLQK